MSGRDSNDFLNSFRWSGILLLTMISLYLCPMRVAILALRKGSRGHGCFGFITSVPINALLFRKELVSEEARCTAGGIVLGLCGAVPAGFLLSSTTRRPRRAPSCSHPRFCTRARFGRCGNPQLARKFPRPER